MSKFKVGDEIRRVIDVDSFVSCHGKDTAIVEDVYNKGVMLEGGNWWYEENFELVDKWSVYDNDKPLRELTDEQVGKLVKHSGAIEHMNKNTLSWGLVRTPSWNKGEIYRAKQKSERDLFIEAALNAANKYNAECDVTFAEAMFDAGFKAPKGGE